MMSRRNTQSEEWACSLVFNLLKKEWMKRTNQWMSLKIHRKNQLWVKWLFVLATIQDVNIAGKCPIIKFICSTNFQMNLNSKCLVTLWEIWLRICTFVHILTKIINCHTLLMFIKKTELDVVHAHLLMLLQQWVLTVEQTLVTKERILLFICPQDNSSKLINR